MADKKKRLGKGLEAIFGNDIDNVINEISNGEALAKGNATKIKVSEIRPNPYQPRKTFDEEGLKELAESIKEHGVFSPILIRKSVKGYELIAGERRLRATKLAKIDTIPAIILDFDDKGMMEVSLLENIQREDLSPIEEAKAYEQLLNKLGYTQDALAKRVSKSRTYITNTMRLLKLPAKVQVMLDKGQISEGAARALININNEDKILEIAKRCVEEGLTVRDIERLSKEHKVTKPKSTPSKKQDPYLKNVKRTLEDKFATQVDIDDKRIVIHYGNVKKLNSILEKMDCLDK